MMERGSSRATLHPLIASPLGLNLPLFDVGDRTELYETPTQQQHGIVTPPTGFRSEPRTNVCEMQCGETEDHGHQTTPLTTNTETLIGKEDTELERDSPIVAVPSSPDLTPVPSSTPPLTEPLPIEAPPTESLPIPVPSSTPPLTEPPPTEVPPTESPLLESDTAYKALYHGALERLHAQSTELAAFRRLVPLVTQLNAVKREHITQVQKTSKDLVLCHGALERKIKEWTDEREEYRAEGERTVAGLVAELVACNATNKVLRERLEEVNKELMAMQTRIRSSENLSTRLQGLLQHKRFQLEACAAETCELKEFTELEKQTLDDTVVELQQKLRDREYDQLAQNARHQEETSRLKEEIERLNFRLKRESIKSYRYQAFSERFVEHIQTQDRKTGKDGLAVELDGDTVRRTLAQWRAISFPKGAENVPPEGADEERERVQLATQVQELNDKLCLGMVEYARLKQMFHDYQAKSVEKIEVLKCNLEKADQEIYQLDDIVDKVVKVMQENMAAVRECPPLHSILQELLGVQD